MTPKLTVDAFRVEYRRAVQDVARFVTVERQATIARHNPGLDPSRTNLISYLEASEARYVRAVGLFANHFRRYDGRLDALDVGGFLGAYPLALARLGLPVTLAEVYAYYEGALDELSTFLASEGIEIWDVDFTEQLYVPVRRKFAMVTNMAMLEHLSESPEPLMRNLHAATQSAGALVIETPNIAYWPKRWTLLRGRSIHPPLDDLLRSASPFLGHHREYTHAELGELLIRTGFRPRAVERFNYSLSLVQGRLQDRLYTLAVYLWPTLIFANCREIILILATPGEHL